VVGKCLNGPSTNQRSPTRQNAGQVPAPHGEAAIIGGGVQWQAWWYVGCPAAGVAQVGTGSAFNRVNVWGARVVLASAPYGVRSVRVRTRWRVKQHGKCVQRVRVQVWRV